WQSFGIGEYEYVVADGIAQVRGGITTVKVEDALFELRPAPGLIESKPIGAGLMVDFALSLPDRDGHTWPVADPAAFERLQSALAEVDIDATNEATRFAAVLVAWNGLQHFHPYFDVAEVDWNAQLAPALAAARDARGDDELVEVLRAMLAQSRDGHGTVIRAGRNRTRFPLPFETGIVEGKVVV